MSINLPKTYDFKAREEYWRKFWEKEKIYQFNICRGDPCGRPRVGTRTARGVVVPTENIFSVDTPPPYVSASHLHVGHIMSYSQAEFIVRYKRMCGFRVFYPMGFDDNGLPTERYVEQKYKLDKSKISRSDFVKLCLKETKIGAQTYKNLWWFLGISVDWTKTYSTIDPHCQRISQWSFIDLYQKGKAVRRQGPIIWCPKCQTALAQADLEDKTERGTLNYIEFEIKDPHPNPSPQRGGGKIKIATTRPELLGACVALYFNPKDKRYQHLKNKKASVPLFNYEVPIKTDATVDPKFGTGIMMVCTFGDKDDISKWQKDKLATRILFDETGRLTHLAGPYQGLNIEAARQKITADLKRQGYLKKQESTEHTLNVHERCSTPAEFIQTRQWFIKVLAAKQDLLKLGRQLKWHPEYMRQKYQDWVKNLQWDWCISRQRYYGVPFPLWYCQKCQEPILAREKDLPIDPLTNKPPIDKCPKCGSADIKPETDVMDTWATSSLTPIIISEIAIPGSVIPPKPAPDIDRVAGIHEIDSRLRGNDNVIYPTTLRPQAFEIIRTWLFYTLVKSYYHHNHLPFKEVMISGHGLDPQGRKISKRLGNFEPPEKIIAQYGADALRYWATGTTLGGNLRYNEDEVKKGKRTVVKIFNASRFALTHLDEFKPFEGRDRSRLPRATTGGPVLTEPVDKWVLHHLCRAIIQITQHFDNYEYAKARDAIDDFFWHIFCDNYLEFVKYRLYGNDSKSAQAARQTLFTLLINILKLYAPFLPFITEEVYQAYFRQFAKAKSIHLSAWPKIQKSWLKPKKFLNEFDKVLNLVNDIRRHKSDRNLSLGQEIAEFRAKEKIPDKYLDFVQRAMRVKRIKN